MYKMEKTKEKCKLIIPPLTGTPDEIQQKLFEIQMQLEFEKREARIKENGEVTLVAHEKIENGMYDGTMDIPYQVPYEWLEKVKEEKEEKEGNKTVAEFALENRGNVLLYQRALNEQIIL